PSAAHGTESEEASSFFYLAWGIHPHALPSLSLRILVGNDRLLSERFCFHRAPRIVEGRSIATFPWRRHLQRLGPRDVWEVWRAVARRLAGGFGFERFQDLFWCDRHFVDAYANCVEHGVGDCGHHRQQRPLTNFLRAEWTARIGFFDQLREHLRHVHRRRTLVLEDRRKLVDERVR